MKKFLNGLDLKDNDATKLWKQIIFVLCLITPIIEVSAQVVCAGNGQTCSDYQNKYGGFLKNFQNGYMPELTKDVVVSQATAQFSPIPFYVNLNGSAVGAFFNGATTEPSRINIYDPYRNKQIPYTERGVAFNPVIFTGSNVGWLANHIYNSYLDITDCKDEENLKSRSVECKHNYRFPILSSIDIYTYGTKFGKNTSYNPLNPFDGRNYWESSGVMIRYHLVDEMKIDFLSNLFSFEGVSIGAGRSKSQQKLRLMINEGSYDLGAGPYDFQWGGKNLLLYNASMRTSYEDLRMGIRLWILRLYWGIGGSQNHGEAEVRYIRQGTVVSTTDTQNNSAVYTVNLDNKTNPMSFNMGYYIAGASIGGFGVHVTESMTKNQYTRKRSYSVGLAFTITF